MYFEGLIFVKICAKLEDRHYKAEFEIGATDHFPNINPLKEIFEF